ncbi:MAG: hemerythrin domain-containing protein [Proteobacteria bacterium]|nr:hemerythrin domain-containing protein [Pseudomonadota bacterium]
MGFKALPADSIAMLDASHRRQEQRLDECLDAVQALTDGRAGQDQVATIARVLEFLRKQAARHVEDEEESVFPRLAARPDFSELLVALESEHREHETMIAELEDLFEAWADAVPPSRAVSVFASRFAEFSAHYRAHIAREDDELVPAMRRELTANELADISSEMISRRPKSSRWSRVGRGRKRRSL